MDLGRQGAVSRVRVLDIEAELARELNAMDEFEEEAEEEDLAEEDMAALQSMLAESAQAEAEDGSILIAGHATDTETSNTNAWIVKMSKQGDVLWSKTYGGEKADEAKARLEAAKQMKNEVQAQFSYANIRAPFNGVVSNKFINEGDMANPGMPLLEVESPGEFQVIAMVPESEISQIKQNSEVKVLIKSLNKTVPCPSPKFQKSTDRLLI